MARKQSARTGRGNRRLAKRRHTLLAGPESLESRLLLATWTGDVFDASPGVPLWTNAEVQQVTGDVHVPAGKTLTIQAGTTVKFNGDNNLVVDGTLKAIGANGQVIVFTSYRDGAGASNGDWGAITFGAGSSANVMDFTEVRYGGYSGASLTGQVIVSGPLALTNSKLLSAWTAGMRIAGAAPTISNVTIKDSLGAAVSMDLAGHPAVSGLTLTNNALNGARLDSGSLSVSNAWDNAGLVYQLSGDVTVPIGKTLTVGAGQVIKANGTNIIVNGTLKATGTTAQPAIFTSFRDDSAGGDTNNNGNSAGIDADWGAIQFNPGSDASSLDHVIVRYGGYSGDVTAEVIVAANISISNSTFSDAYQGGMRITGSNPTLVNDTWLNNVDRINAPPFAVSMDLVSRPVITNPTLLNNSVNGVLLDSGSLPGSTTWDISSMPYRLSGNVTVPTGVTLTVAPGQVIKFAGSTISLFVNGTLHAAGTAALPVIFTSYRDDTAGGDTNNDGSVLSSSLVGDWGAIQFGSGSSGNLMDHIELRYGGFYDAPGDPGVIMDGGALTLSNSTIRDAGYSGIVLSPGASASLTSNLFVHNHITGILAQAGSTLTAVNNTIDGTDYVGVELDSPNATLTNNLITNSGTDGILQTGPTNLTMKFNDVFHSGLKNYNGLADPTGANGNVSVDPKYFNRANRQYQLRPGSPVEDAGTASGAPATDLLGNPRFDDPNITGRGDGSGYDLGALEVQEIATSTIDLATLNVSGPTTGTQGMNATVNWTVKNVGSGVASGSWSDAIYLSDTPVWTSDAKFLKRVQHTGDLGPDQSYDGTTSVTLNNVLPGNHYFIVRSNDLQEVFEGLAAANNSGASAAPISFAMPTLTLGMPFNDQFTASGQAKYYQITVAGGQTLAFALQSAAGSGATELYVSRGSIPSRSQFDFGASAFAPNQQAIVPFSQPGTYYVLAYAASGSAATSAFTLTASQAVFGVAGVAPQTAGNSGKVTLTVKGSLLTPDTQVSLLAPDSSTVAALSTHWIDATQLQATFDLAGKAAGMYGVSAKKGGQTVSATNALTVSAGVTGHLKVEFIVPGAVRAGTQGTVTVEYTNDGGADLPAPVLAVVSDTSTLRFTSDTTARGDTAEFLAINSSGDAGVLPPGAHGSIDINFVAATNVTSSNFSLLSQSTDHASMTLDWAAAKANMRPANEPADAWEAIYANFVADVGTTLGSFQALLDRQATYLSRLGEYSGDEGRLLALEFQQAGNLGTITRRYALGAFGRGIPDPTALKATADAAGNLSVLSGGSERSFSIQPDHSYRGAPGDLGVLTLTNGAYRLQEADGSIVAFRTDGRFDFSQDANGNRVTAGYTSGQLTSYTDNFGDKTSLSYNAQGRISQITDPVGRTTTFSYGAAGEHLLSITNPQGTTQFTYITGQSPQSEHALASIAYPDGTHAFFTYDSRGRLIKTTADGGANEIDYSYDGVGGVTASDVQHNSTTTLFNEFGQPALDEDALGNITRYIYDTSHNLTQLVRPDGSTVSVTPDNRHNPATIVDPLGRQINSTFDPTFGTLQTLRDPRGNTLSFRTDAHGNPLSVSYPSGQLEQFAYDAAGNVTSRTDRAGNQFHYTYDAHNLLLRVGFSDGTHTDFTYDAHRNLTTATSAVGATTYDYDLATDRLMKVTYPGGRFLSFTYDTAGRRSKSVDQGSFTTNYSYDALGRLQSLKDGGGNAIVAYTYDTVGRLQKQDMGNGTFTTYDYDAAGQVKSLINHAKDGSVISQFDYTYDSLGNALTMTTGGATTSYSYDGVSQLTSVSLPGRTITYQYEAAGNRVAVTDNGATTNYSANNLNQYTSAGSAQFAYDANGNLLSRTDAGGTTTYTYNLQGQLASVTTPTDTYSYVYDALGSRIAVIHNGARTDYLIDPIGFGNVAAEYGTGGQLVAHYTHGAGLASRVDAGGSSAAYYAFDASGNTSSVTASDGSVANRYSYLPFGETLSATGSLPNNFTFAGQFGVMSEGNGLYFMRARYYDSKVGQFVSDDPLGLAGGDINYRRYVDNNPVTRADPPGLLTELQQTAILLMLEAHKVSSQVNEGAKTLGVGGYVESAEGKHNFARLNLLKSLARVIYPLLSADDFRKIHEVIKSPQPSAEAPAGSSAENGELQAVQEIQAGIKLKNPISHEVTWFRPNTSDQSSVGSPVPADSPEVTDVLASTSDANKALKEADKLHLIDPLGIFFPLLPIFRDLQTRFAAPVDPNDISGPLGFGTQHFVGPDQMFPYTILFENQPSATAPALVVKVTQQLDAKLDWTTFELGDFGFGKYVVNVPAGRRFYSTRVDASETVGEFVDVVADFDPATGLATWTFTSVDPKTGILPTGVTDGFLPPDDAAQSGEGFVTYRVQPKGGAATGDAVPAKARVFFDAGLADESFLDTPVFMNTFDTGVPTSKVTALPVLDNAVFTVQWTGADDTGGSGIGTYDVFVSDNSGPFTLFRGNTTSTSATFTGQGGHSYRFYSIATDNVGHVEAAPATFDAQTTTTAHPWYNAPRPLDADNNGQVAPLDALVIINYLNAKLPSSVPPAALTGGGPGFLDTNANDEVAPLDALLVINGLNAGLGEGEPQLDSLTAAATGPDPAADFANLLALLASDLADLAPSKRRRTES